MSQSEDLEAIDRYIGQTAVKTGSAATIHDEWIMFYDSLSWYSKNYDSDSYDLARNIRNRFNLANSTTAAERANVERVMQTGVTTEEMAGGSNRTLASGMLAGPVKYEEPWLSDGAKAIIIGGSVLAALGWIVSKGASIADKLKPF